METGRPGFQALSFHGTYCVTVGMSLPPLACFLTSQLGIMTATSQNLNDVQKYVETSIFDVVTRFFKKKVAHKIDEKSRKESVKRNLYKVLSNFTFDEPGR